jgi:2-methylfumaryl-CoA hydratase
MKTNPGNFFEDFKLGQSICHAVPRTVTAGDAALYIGLTGSRFALPSSDTFAHILGYDHAPIDDLLVFHIVFGRTVADISLNAIANLGYADCRFGVPVFPGDTLLATSEVIGLKENSNGESGVVYVHTTGWNQRDQIVLEFIRWVMVRKRDKTVRLPETKVPGLPEKVALKACILPDSFVMVKYDRHLSGSPYLWEDYAVGEKIDHVDGMTLEEADHMTAARLYQNNAKVHFNQHVESQSRFGKRLVYGGHIISIARALSFNGLANAFKIVAINGGRHVGPSFAGDTIYAWSEVLEKEPAPGRNDLGLLRLRTTAVKDCACANFPAGDAALLELDFSVLMPRHHQPDLHV